ncbi:MAG TPA: hypothetical protein VGT41_02665 [Candidatus Babeliales bacterium]|nr:hypothetical protein [Candidatus Babeliales bacterium]
MTSSINRTLYFLAFLGTIFYFTPTQPMLRAEPVKTMQSFHNGTIAVATDQNTRDYMEDRHFVSDSQLLFGLFDGHGGQGVAQYIVDNSKYKDAGKKVSRFEHFFNFLKQQNPNLDDAQLLIKSLKSIEQRLWQDADTENAYGYLGTKNLEKYGESGATAIVAKQTGNILTIANVGDSRAVLIRDRQIVQSTKDHKPSLEDEKKRIRKTGNTVRQGRIWIRTPEGSAAIGVSRSIGDVNFKKGTGQENFDDKNPAISSTPDIYTWEVKAGDILIMACDGLWDVMDSKKDAGDNAALNTDILEKYSHFTQMTSAKLADTLVAIAKRWKSGDNLTVLVAKITAEPAAAAPSEAAAQADIKEREASQSPRGNIPNDLLRETFEAALDYQQEAEKNPNFSPEQLAVINANIESLKQLDYKQVSGNDLVQILSNIEDALERGMPKPAALVIPAEEPIIEHAAAESPIAQGPAIETVAEEPVAAIEMPIDQPGEEVEIEAMAEQPVVEEPAAVEIRAEEPAVEVPVQKEEGLKEVAAQEPEVAIQPITEEQFNSILNRALGYQLDASGTPNFDPAQLHIINENIATLTELPKNLISQEYAQEVLQKIANAWESGFRGLPEELAVGPAEPQEVPFVAPEEPEEDVDDSYGNMLGFM